MTSKDIRDILSLQPTTVAGPSNAPPPKKPKTGRPAGISRELQALIGDSAPSLAQVRAELGIGEDGGRYKERKEGRKKVNWTWKSFKPAHHPGALQLTHWTKNIEGVPAVDEDPFAAFGNPTIGPNVMEYSQVEYDEHLADPDWTPSETAYLFSLLRAYDLRFLIVADRYAYLPPGSSSGQDAYPYPVPPPKPPMIAGGEAPAGGSEKRATRSTRSEKSRGKGKDEESPLVGLPVTGVLGRDEVHESLKGAVKVRSLEEIKNRYFTVCRRLVRTRPAADDAQKEKMVAAYAFDMEREIARKKYASSLFHLTRPQILEEESLYLSLSQISQTQARYVSEREELMKLLSGLESGVFYPDGVGGNRVFGNGASWGVGGARGADGVVNMEGSKMRKRKRGEEGGEMGVEVPEPVLVVPTGGKVKKVDPVFDDRHHIYRVPAAQASHIASSRYNVPAFLRSSKLTQIKFTDPAPAPPLPKPTLSERDKHQNRVYGVVSANGIQPNKLVMPTKANVEKYEVMLLAVNGLLEMKKQVDRVEQEIRVLKLQKEAGGVSTESLATVVAKKAARRSTSVLSSTPSEANKKSRKG